MVYRTGKTTQSTTVRHNMRVRGGTSGWGGGRVRVTYCRPRQVVHVPCQSLSFSCIPREVCRGASAALLTPVSRQEPTDVAVKVSLSSAWRLSALYPKPDTGDAVAAAEWSVHALPDGTLTHTRTGRQHSSLFWEGETVAAVSEPLFVLEPSTGFCVRGDEAGEWLDTVCV